MPPESDPQLNLPDAKSEKESFLLWSLIGAVLGAIAFSQLISTLGFFLDIAADSSMKFRVAGSAVGLLIGSIAGALAGRQFGKGERPSLRVIAAGAIFCGLMFSATLFIPSAVHPIAKTLSPMIGLISGSILGAITSLLLPGIMKKQ